MDFLGLLGLLLLYLSGRGAPPATAPSPGPWGPTPRARRRRRTPPIVEPSEASLPPSPSPWPQVLPPGLPTFPGSAWEFDEPPPIEVQQRAAQLVSTLWSRGAGAHKVEQTAGRWIAYQAQIVASGKQGIVAYRLKKTLPKPEPQTPPSTNWTVKTGTAPPRRQPRGEHWWRKPPVAVPRRAMPPIDQPPIEPQGKAVSPISVMDLPTLRVGMGMSGAPNRDVALMQQRLPISPADGRFGPGTLAAVRAYQTRHGLAADGVVGKQTWAMLFTARGNRASA